VNGEVTLRDWLRRARDRDDDDDDDDDVVVLAGGTIGATGVVDEEDATAGTSSDLSSSFILGVGAGSGGGGAMFEPVVNTANKASGVMPLRSTPPAIN